MTYRDLISGGAGWPTRVLKQPSSATLLRVRALHPGEEEAHRADVSPTVS